MKVSDARTSMRTRMSSAAPTDLPYSVPNRAQATRAIAPLLVGAAPAWWRGQRRREDDRVESRGVQARSADQRRRRCRAGPSARRCCPALTEPPYWIRTAAAALAPWPRAARPG